MELYKENITKVGLERTFRTKLKMFEYIANTLSATLHITRTAEQCLNRYLSILCHHHISVTNIRSSLLLP